MTLITTINEYKQYLLENNNITPIRVRDSSLTDIIDFVEEILYQPSKIDITEKIAGQHLTVNIQNGHVTLNIKYTDIVSYCTVLPLINYKCIGNRMPLLIPYISYFWTLCVIILLTFVPIYQSWLHGKTYRSSQLI